MGPQKSPRVVKPKSTATLQTKSRTKDILGSSRPPDRQSPLPQACIEAAYAQQAEDSAATDKKEEMLALALLNKSLGKQDQADTFFRIYEKMLDSSTSISTCAVPSKRGNEASSSSNGEKKSCGPLFDPEKCNRSTNLGFTQYFNRNIREMLGPIPLMIFDQKWQAAALAYQTEKRPTHLESSGKKSGCYHGYPYPSKWSLNAGEWEQLYLYSMKSASW
ncbi:hypothetical protein PCASD_06028 [Puccinia coronata f. sp. avenae]|uniref:Uncharacterized protein n=1 Tax=Puccinia coronata f. sp. avenae TaxID=200324 RepID=A0A2N5V9V3_9BASI|nr:hypothetical protein PCASD_06028 [Puccinia coronata f. sp. avenae]